MKDIYQSNRFKRDLKRIKKRGLDVSKLSEIVKLIADEQELPARCRPHKLVGNYEGFWECHIEPDWLLVYDVAEEHISLVATGSHSDLFR